MIIGIDGNEANTGKRVGIGEYAYELVTQFYGLRQQGKFENISFRIYLKDKPTADMPKETSWWTYALVGPKKLWTQLGLPLHLLLDPHRPDVFFTPTHYAPRFATIPTAISIMDLSYLHFPELFAKKDLYQLTNWTEYSAKQATYIFTISNSSRNDIIKSYKVKPDRVTVTYPGIREVSLEKAAAMETLLKKYTISPRYILFVGTLQPRKNIVGLIQAFSLLKKEKAYEDVDLVVVGKKGWLYEETLQAPEKYGVVSSVKFLDFVPNEDLPSLYKYAQCYVLPSLYEGFGLPVLEAMQYGCPVITSNISSLPEAGGDAALYVDPKDAADIAAKIKKVVDNKDVRENMVKKGYAHLKKFSWEKAAEETLKVLESLGK